MPLVISGAVSGSTTLQATDAVTATITLPSATDTLVGKTTPSFTTTIGVGNATPSASGAGITFPATQSASTDANTLDDYEEGTWTPTVVGTSTAGTVTYTTQVGRYTKIGNRVFYQFTVTYTSGTGTGFLRVTGLPFVNASGSGFNPPQTIAIQNITLNANHYVVGDCPQGQSRIDVYSQPTGGGATADVSYDASGEIYCSGQYFIA
jgi:hypothetical protein